MQDLNLTEYSKIREEYLSNANKDIDPFTAYNLMVRASGQMEYIDTIVADYEALCAEYDFIYDKVLSATSIELTNSKQAKSIADAQRQCMGLDIVQEAKDNHIKARKSCDYFKAYSKFMGRVYFDCKAIYQAIESKGKGG